MIWEEQGLLSVLLDQPRDSTRARGVIGWEIGDAKVHGASLIPGSHMPAPASGSQTTSPGAKRPLLRSGDGRNPPDLPSTPLSPRSNPLKQLSYLVNWRALDRLLAFVGWMVALALVLAISLHFVHAPSACRPGPATQRAVAAGSHEFQISARSPLFAGACSR